MYHITSYQSCPMISYHMTTFLCASLLILLAYLNTAISRSVLTKRLQTTHTQ